MDGSDKYLSIKSWSHEDRPREKLLSKGKKSLSNAELLAIILGSGSRGESALSLCKRILNDCSNDLNKLNNMEVSDLMKYKGIGAAKAVNIVAALELGRRREGLIAEVKPVLVSSQDTVMYLGHKLRDIKIEVFWAIFTNNGNRVITEHLVSRGGISATVVDVKVLIKKALDILASGIILLHNHPSGNTKPSKKDVDLTDQIIAASKLMGMTVIDHIIITDNDYFSFRDNGMI